jgi:hypothetical protein
MHCFVVILKIIRVTGHGAFLACCRQSVQSSLSLASGSCPRAPGKCNRNFMIPKTNSFVRWLCNKDRHEEALQIFTKWHGEGNEEDEFVQLEYAEVRAAIELDKQSGQTGWSDFFKTKGNRKRIGIITAIGIFSQWSGNGLISYYLKYVMDEVGMTDPQTQLGINGGMKTLALCENFIFSFLIDKLGRRPIYLISTIGTFVTFNIWTIISARYDVQPQNSLGYGFVVMIFMYGIFYDIKSGLMAGYTTEILPYGLRAKGFVWLNFCVTGALFFNQFVNGLALDALAWKYYIFYCVFLALEVGIIYFFIVETRYVKPLTVTLRSCMIQILTPEQIHPYGGDFKVLRRR